MKVAARSIWQAALRVPTVLWVLMAMIAHFARATPNFFSGQNALNLFTQGSILLILCMGVIVVKITGGIELSNGAVLSLAGFIMAYTLSQWKLPIPVSLAITLMVGVLCGLLNGFFVAKLRIPSFIATLGTQGIATGLSLGLSNARVIAGLPPSIARLGSGTFAGLPVPIWATLLAFASSYVLLNMTKFGVYIYAIGGNEEALNLAGKPSWKYKALAYAYSGLTAGLAAIVLTARNVSAHPTVGLGLEFQAFSGVVLGGSFAAGRGTVGGAVIGALFILVLRNGLNVMGVPTYIQLAVTGPALIGAIVLSTVVERRVQKQ